MLVRSLLVACFLFFIGNVSIMAGDHDYIGSKKCKMCHNKPATGEQFKQWAASKHAHAMESLKGDEKTNPKCLKCHSTAATAKPERIAGLTVEEGVSCESCHGAGGDYFQTAIMKNREKALEKGLIIPNEKTCLACHNAESPTFKGFNYQEALKQVIHPNPAAKK